MGDPIETPAPDDTGSETLERYEFQAHAALRAVLLVLAGDVVQHVTCEHIEDVIVASRQPSTEADLRWDFQQVKSRNSVEPWTLTSVLAAKPLKSLWRTHKTVSGTAIDYRLTASLEGPLDPADDKVIALSRGEGARNEACLTRVMRHLGAERASVAKFLELVHIQVLPRRGEIELRNTAALAELGPHLTNDEIKSLYEELLRRVREAMQGKLGGRWQLLITQPDIGDRVRRKRLARSNVIDIHQRLCRPDHILLGDISEQLTDQQTALVRKLRAGAASSETVEDAQSLRAHADHHRLNEQALGTWSQDPAIAADLDQRLLLVARRAVVRHRHERPSPADAIFYALMNSLEDRAETHDRRPLYAQDGLLLMGRACALSDECLFDWGQANDRNDP